ncbi:YkvA family protein [Lutibacter citreus]|uniref:YkvA family protein n=1 Tax=Lutibacter citreus TaxID=2138210 RepID=UPI000DBE8B78|nr:YkvA family protein [Lutibacter citreus]
MKDFNEEFQNGQNDFSQNDLKRILEKSEELNSKFKEEGKLRKFYKKFKLFISMLKDYISGSYTEVPWYVITVIGSTFLYVINPIDLIPDFLPFIGYVDDAAIMAICVSFVNEEIQAYEKWKIRAN